MSQPSLRVLIVDDARLARAELRTLLAQIADVELVGEAEDVPQARAAIARLHPDLVLLDIQMPSGSGFDVLADLETVPAVVFTTAYDHYALQAFGANALDYLLKPVDPARLTAALDKARGNTRTAMPSSAERERLGAQDHVFLRDGERCWFVAIGDISRIVVDGNYARVGFGDQSALVTRSLAALEARLDPALFFRANRNTLVNLRHIRTVEPSIADGYSLRLADGGEVEVSRRQARELRERLAL